MQEELHFTLTPSERDRLEFALHAIPYDPAGGTTYLNQLRLAGLSHLPARIVQVLTEQRSSIAPLPYLVFDNLPTDEQVFNVPNPQVYTPAAKSGTLSENLVMCFAVLLGEPYSIRFEGQDIVNNLIPTTATRRDYTGLGSEVELDFHIENAALKHLQDHNFSPAGLLLTGVRQDPAGPLTRLADGRQALARLTEQDIAILRSPLFRISVPYRWRSTGSEHCTIPVALICGSSALPELSAVFYPGMIDPINDAARDALARFYLAVKAVSFGVEIEPGRLVFIDNRFTFHARDKFTPTLDHREQPMRWIQRVFIAASLWNHRHLQRLACRVFEPSTGSTA